MILSIANALLLSASTLASPSHYNYTEWMPTSFLSKGITLSRSYQNAVLYTGLELASNETSNETLFAFVKAQIDAVVSPSGALIDYYPSQSVSLDDIRIGLNLLRLWTKTHDPRYKVAADTLRAQLDVTPRTPSGGFWHRKPTYPNQMWLDGIFMAQNFYAVYTSWFQPGNRSAWDDILLQFDLIEEHCRDPGSGLLYHGYDESREAVWADPITGAAPLVWSRAVGWYFMSLVDILEYFPRQHPGYRRTLNRFRSLAAALKKTQDDLSGGWYLIMNEPYPSDPRNYIESSATAMFAYGFLKGMRMGYLGRSEYGEPADRAYALMRDAFVTYNANGTLNWEGTVQVGSLGSNGSFEYYVSVPVVQNDYKGAGPFIYAAYEKERS